MSALWCPTCRAYKGLEPHKCPPLWLCDVDDQGDWGEHYGATPIKAAERVAKSYWEDECPDQDETIEVQVKVDGEIQTFVVAASWALEITARIKS